MAESQPNGGPAWWRRHWLALTLLGLIVLLACAVMAATVLPPWIVSISGVKADENHRLDAIGNTRGALLGVLAPVVVTIGALAAFLNYRVAAANLHETAEQNRRTAEQAQRTLDVAERGQLTERFTKAIEQLAACHGHSLDRGFLEEVRDARNEIAHEGSMANADPLAVDAAHIAPYLQPLRLLFIMALLFVLEAAPLDGPLLEKWDGLDAYVPTVVVDGSSLPEWHSVPEIFGSIE